MKITGLDEERHGRRWNGQRALVTGAGQGIGQAVAQLLASKGVKVAVNDIVPERAENTVKLIADAGGEAFAAIGDIADPTVVEDLFRQLDERFGGIDILVNVAVFIAKFLLCHCMFIMMAVTDSIDNVICKGFTGYVYNLFTCIVFLNIISNCMHKMRFAKSRSTINVKRIVCVTRLFSNF